LKVDPGVQEILRFCLSNLKSYNIGISDERNVLRAPLKWAKVS
jgi:hypothetical protein